MILDLLGRIDRFVVELKYDVKQFGCWTIEHVIQRESINDLSHYIYAQSAARDLSGNGNNLDGITILSTNSGYNFINDVVCSSSNDNT